MSLADAQEIARMVDEARDSFVSESENELERFHTLAGAVLTLAETPAEVRTGLDAPTTALIVALAALWASALNDLLGKAHKQVGLPAPPRYSALEARELMTPGAAGLLSAALLTWRTARVTRQPIKAAWARQYEKGGGFVALRGAIRAATAGTYNTLTNASLIDVAQQTGGFVLGAYNPLDERTAPLDFALCTNTGGAITTARGRVVRSIPGQQAKYTFANAWLPGPPRSGADTHSGCRCLLIPEKLETAS